MQVIQAPILIASWNSILLYWRTTTGQSTPSMKALKALSVAQIVHSEDSGGKMRRASSNSH
jgi:hypothetical protein